MDIVQDDMQIRKQKILDEFDFHKVHKAMKAVKWKWGVTRKSYITRKHYHTLDLPTIDELKKTATRLLQQVIDHKETTAFIGTGGFEASKQGEILGLTFRIESKIIYKFGEHYVSC